MAGHGVTGTGEMIASAQPARAFAAPGSLPMSFDRTDSSTRRSWIIHAFSKSEREGTSSRARTRAHVALKMDLVL